MGRIGLAFRAFFGTLFSSEKAERVSWAFGNEPLPNRLAPPSSELPTKPEKAPAKPARSEALTLLEALQREARLIDLCQESLDGYSDEQIGAAARNVIRDSARVLERYFALQPIASVEEGSTLEVPAGFEPARYRLTGNISGTPPFVGRVQHCGWQATRCELPNWTGHKETALLVAPVEVEVA